MEELELCLPLSTFGKGITSGTCAAIPRTGPNVGSRCSSRAGLVLGAAGLAKKNPPGCGPAAGGTRGRHIGCIALDGEGKPHPGISGSLTAPPCCRRRESFRRSLDQRERKGNSSLVGRVSKDPEDSSIQFPGPSPRYARERYNVECPPSSSVEFRHVDRGGVAGLAAHLHGGGLRSPRLLLRTDSPSFPYQERDNPRRTGKSVGTFPDCQGGRSRTVRWRGISVEGVIKGEEFAGISVSGKAFFASRGNGKVCREGGVVKVHSRSNSTASSNDTSVCSTGAFSLPRENLAPRQVLPIHCKGLCHSRTEHGANAHSVVPGSKGFAGRAAFPVTDRGAVGSENLFLGFGRLTHKPKMPGGWVHHPLPAPPTNFSLYMVAGWPPFLNNE
eukprot:Gb_29325 [translate_table: standard]